MDVRKLSGQSLCVLFLVAATISADELIYRYEADTLPSAPGAGWIVFDPCGGLCTERVEDGHYILEWPDEGGNAVNFHHDIAIEPETTPPPTLWAEWRFRSNFRFQPFEYGCDGRLSEVYRHVHEPLYLHGDAVVSFSGDIVFSGLSLDEFYTVRFESQDGVAFRYSVEGQVFYSGSGDKTQTTRHYLQFGGLGSCLRESTMRSEWDFIRYGTIGEGEAVVASDPPAGKFDAMVYGNLDRFRVTFDEPNFVYINDVTVEVSGGPVPAVTGTRRTDTGGPETVEIVLDRALTVGETTRFTFATGGTPNVVEYAPVYVGACCLSDGTCEDRFESECPGAFHEQVECPGLSACCSSGGACTAISSLCCTDRGGTPAALECDADGDGDSVDAACGDGCPDDPDKLSPGVCGCGVADTDSDADTVRDCHDQCPGGDDLVDNDGDGSPDCALGLLRIPTVSWWGLAVLTLVLLVAAKLRFRSRLESAR